MTNYRNADIKSRETHGYFEEMSKFQLSLFIIAYELLFWICLWRAEHDFTSEGVRSKILPGYINIILHYTIFSIIMYSDRVFNVSLHIRKVI